MQAASMNVDHVRAVISQDVSTTIGDDSDAVAAAAAAAAPTIDDVAHFPAHGETVVHIQSDSAEDAVEFNRPPLRSTFHAAAGGGYLFGTSAIRWSMRDFRTLNKLGSGKASTVYRVHHISSGMEMALKCYFRSQLSPQMLSLIRDEIDLHSTVQHPAITSFYGWFEDPRGNVFLVLELAKRGDVFNAIYNGNAAASGLSGRRTGTLSESQACRTVIRPLVSAVAHLHAKGIMHRDIKVRFLLLPS